LVAAFGDWLQAHRRKISAKSRLGEKLGRIHNYWDGLQTFLTDGRVGIDSNRVENLIRPIALNRKNALFAGHDEGGIAWGRIASLIETCAFRAHPVTGSGEFGHPVCAAGPVVRGGPWHVKPDLCRGEPEPEPV
jgi:hypothetical protein